MPCIRMSLQIMFLVKIISMGLKRVFLEKTFSMGASHGSGTGAGRRVSSGGTVQAVL